MIFRSLAALRGPPHSPTLTGNARGASVTEVGERPGRLSTGAWFLRAIGLEPDDVVPWTNASIEDVLTRARALGALPQDAAVAFDYHVGPDYREGRVPFATNPDPLAPGEIVTLAARPRERRGIETGCGWTDRWRMRTTSDNCATRPLLQLSTLPAYNSWTLLRGLREDKRAPIKDGRRKDRYLARHFRDGINEAFAAQRSGGEIGSREPDIDERRT